MPACGPAVLRRAAAAWPEYCWFYSSALRGAPNRVTRRGARDVDDPVKLRELAAWYRTFAEQSGNPTIWDGRLRTAEDLEAEATELETRAARARCNRYLSSQTSSMRQPL